MLDTGTGHLLRRLLRGANPVSFALDTSTGRLAVETVTSVEASVLYILDATSGRVLYRLLPSHGGYLVADSLTGRLYMQGSGSTIASLNTRAGRLSAFFPVGDGLAVPASLNIAVFGGRAVALRGYGEPPPVPASADPLGWLPRWLRRLLPWQPPRQRAIPGVAILFAAPR